MKPPIVCICGSTLFIELMAVLAWEFEKRRTIALSCHLLPASYTTTEHHVGEEEGAAENLDELHLRKIDLADSVLIVNKNGYIGSSTQNEIAYAIATGKPLEFHQPVEGEDFMLRNSHELGLQVAKHVQEKQS